VHSTNFVGTFGQVSIGHGASMDAWDGCARSLCYQRCRERAERLTHDDQILPVARGLDHDAGIFGEAGRFVIGRKVGSNHAVSVRTQLGLD
jgi:hypothetical protein